jgi:hypothetical protein
MRVALLLVLASGLAHADGEIPLSIELGKRVEVNVGYARGYFCDDPSLIQAEVVNRGDYNVWVVTGAKLGQTLCRVGTDPYAPARVFDLRVVPAKKKK